MRSFSGGSMVKNPPANAGDGISLKRYVQMLYEKKHETLLRDKKVDWSK